MGLAQYRVAHDRFQTADANGKRNRAFEHRDLENCRTRLFRVRLELAELKRTGSRQGLADLASDAAMLSMHLKRLESLLRQGAESSRTTQGNQQRY
jgi:hypothetical protein